MNKEFTVEQLKLRLDRFLAEQEDLGISRSKIQKDIAAGLVAVNGNKVLEGKYIVQKNDKIVYDFTAASEQAVLPPRHLDIKTLYENEDVLIIDKPAGLVVHPAPGYKGLTLAEGLLEKYKDIKLVGEDEIRPGIVHRLDKDTSGAMLVAKTQKAFEYLKDAFAKRRIKKEYLALLVGRLNSKHGFINKPIGRHSTDFRKMTTHLPKEPKESLSEYNVLGYYKQKGNVVDEYTFIRVKLHTGRTHQIRVHFSSLGYPIAGDTLYGNRKANLRLPILTRQFLHAEKLELQLPDGIWIEASSELPEDLKTVLNNLQLE